MRIQATEDPQRQTKSKQFDIRRDARDGSPRRCESRNKPMTLRQTDNTTFWRLVGQYVRAGIKDNYGTAPLVPSEAMLAICQRISTKTKP